MSDSNYITLAEEFFANNPKCSEALEQLKSGVEIKLNFEHKDEAALFYNDGLELIHRKANNYDVEFIIHLEALRQLHAKKNLNISEVGIEFLKQVLLGHAEIKIHGNILNILSNGYIKIIKLAGPDFLNFLSEHGLGSLQKIIQFIRNR